MARERINKLQQSMTMDLIYHSRPDGKSQKQ